MARRGESPEALHPVGAAIRTSRRVRVTTDERGFRIEDAPGAGAGEWTVLYAAYWWGTERLAFNTPPDRGGAALYLHPAGGESRVPVLTAPELSTGQWHDLARSALGRTGGRIVLDVSPATGDGRKRPRPQRAGPLRTGWVVRDGAADRSVDEEERDRAWPSPAT